MLSPTGLTLGQLVETLDPSNLEPQSARELFLAAGSPGGKRGGKISPPARAAPAAQPRPPRRRAVPAGPVPRRVDTTLGWSDLLGEISESSRRVRVARGGRIGSANGHPGGLPSLSTPGEFGPPLPAAASPRPSARGTGTGAVVSTGPATGAAATPRPPSCSPAAVGSGGGGVVSPAARVPADEEEVWQSYRIDEEKVSDSTLRSIWRCAKDPKHCHDEVKPLSRVPRLTVTRREVQQLPVVHDIEHFRQFNRRRREQRKLREESETFPSLGEMLKMLFGEQPPPRLRMKQIKTTYQKMLSSVRSQKALTKWVMRAPAAADEIYETELQAEVQRQLAQDAAEEAKHPPPADVLGVRRKGRRNAVDYGQPTGQPLAELPEASHAQGRSKDSKLIRNLEAFHAASGADERDRLLEQVVSSSKRVQDRCQQKVQGMHDSFVRKQGQLSGRLQRRVQRLQIDFQEIHDKKVSLILPGSVTGSEAAAASSAALEATTTTAVVASGGGRRDQNASVLAYLRCQRHHVERDRQSRHATYLQQVERFQSHLRLLADPNRHPERGEAYLSECFRHVLSAGLIVDNDYFFRVLAHLELEDFARASTVNLLAACCDAFGVDLRRYWAFLEARGVPQMTPRPSSEEVRTWQDGAPWCGVALQALEELMQQERQPSLQAPGEDDIPSSAHDPLPFNPIMPEELPTASELASRDDPLRDILDVVALDSVLERYYLGKGAGSRRRGSFSGTSSDEQILFGAEDEEAEERLSMLVAEAAAADLVPSAALAPLVQRARSARPRRPLARGYPTLRSTRGLGENLVAAAAAQAAAAAPAGSLAADPLRRPAPWQAPAMSWGTKTVAERPGFPVEPECLE